MPRGNQRSRQDAGSAAATERQLAHWLHEWEVFCLVDGNETVEPGGETIAGPVGSRKPSEVGLSSPTRSHRLRRALRAPDGQERPSSGRGDTPTAGQIWLLPEGLSPHGPRYAAVVETSADSHQVSLVPFGLLAVPAIPGELGIDRGWPLAVLCPWNRFTIPSEALTAGWLVDSLSPAEEQAVRRVAGLVPDDGGDGAESAIYSGPPLRHPLDPRHEYMDLEREFTESIQAAARQNHPLIYPYPTRPAGDLPLAAESDETPYGE